MAEKLNFQSHHGAEKPLHATNRRHGARIIMLATQCVATWLMAWVSSLRRPILFVGSTLIGAEMRVEMLMLMRGI
jgi:hypothetical protein